MKIGMSPFAKLVLEDREAEMGYSISAYTRALLQNLMAEAAEEMIAEVLKSDLTPAKERENIRYLQGQIDLLKGFLAQCDIMQESQESPENSES